MLQNDFVIILHPCLHDSACLVKIVNNVNILIIKFMKVRNYFS